MRWKDIRDPNPKARTRELRRLYLVKVFDGDPNDPDTPIREEQVIAWNAVDANNQFSEDLVCEPEDLGYVTWPREGHDKDDIFFIDNPKDGATDRRPFPTVEIRDEQEEDWFSEGGN